MIPWSGGSPQQDIGKRLVACTGADFEGQIGVR
jgi:hypothetical protein